MLVFFPNAIIPELLTSPQASTCIDPKLYSPITQRNDQQTPTDQIPLLGRSLLDGRLLNTHFFLFGSAFEWCGRAIEHLWTKLVIVFLHVSR